jgi:hypothetical protein
MVWTKNVGTPYHQQETPYYCGAAVAQMILEEIGAGILNQDILYNSNHTHNQESGWYTDPVGLEYTLNDNRPSAFLPNYFDVMTYPTEAEASKKIVYTLWKYGVATGTLIFAGSTGCDHWIAVRGVQTSVEPKPGNTYSINGFFINNPWPPVPSYYNPTLAPPPPHSNTDGCGGGGNRGVTNEYVVHNDWKNTYFKGCSWSSTSKQYISVCDPEPPKLGEYTMRYEERWAKGDQIINPELASSFALKGLDEHHLHEEKSFSTALRDAKPGRPILVQRLDLLDAFYYIVPMVKTAGATAMLKVNGLYGNFEGGQAFEKPIEQPFVNVQAILKEIIGKPIELGDKRGRLILREKAYCLYPMMVWRPCCESRSPYYPFYMITVGADTIYIGYDGSVFSELHDFGPGG